MVQINRQAHAAKSTKATKATKLTTAARLPELLAPKPTRPVEDMLRDISLVLWLTQKVKNEILAEGGNKKDALTSMEELEAVCAEV
jgi:hypothetical protein